ncbi:MAG: mycofactocin-coupled SDR family oxidoreductase [Actinobacteria bacterium]|nr:mycofactocin-coupled SDR family oxidoreductase [Actinomycetota bacterium]
MGRLDGKVAYITGGARGQGAAHARTFAREGADIVIIDLCADLGTVRYPLADREDLDAVAADVRGLGRRCIAAVADVREQDQLDAVTAQALEEFGKIDIVFANAGIQGVAKFWEMTEEQWDDMIAINQTGVWKTAKSTAPSMIERESGSLILTGSMNCHEGLPEYCHYTASKHAVMGLMKCFAIELGPHNIRVNCICPGVIDTPLLDNPMNREWAAGFKGADKDDALAAARHWSILKGTALLPPEAISEAAVFLASDEGRYIHGTSLDVDAGHMVMPGFNHAPVQPEGFPRRQHEGYNPYAT